MKPIEYLRRFKPAYSLYNFFFPQHLKYNETAFRKFNIHKNYFDSISSDDFQNANPGERPWLDVQSSAEALPSKPEFRSLNASDREAIIHWSGKGYAILPQYFSKEELSSIDEELASLVREKKVKPLANGKIMFAIHHSQRMRQIVSPPRLEEMLSLLLGKRVRLFQSINFNSGSQQAAHSDSIHMTTFPPGYLIAAWIALEEITLNNGPVFYYPGSHQLPYPTNSDFQTGRNKWLIGKQDYSLYEKKTTEEISQHTEFEKKYFTAKAGDVLVWHANLLHGGEKINVPGATRRSMVLHYFCEDVICYHEISERPAIIK